MIKYFYILLCFLLISCETELTDIDYTIFYNDEFLNSLKLNETQRTLIEGIYNVDEGNERFSDQIILKFTGNTLTMLCDRNVYAVLEHQVVDDNIIFEGYWRIANGSQAGKISLQLINLSQINSKEDLVFEGNFNNPDNSKKDKAIRFSFNRDIPIKKEFKIIAHRGGGRNSDRLPASENSIELIKIAQNFGANAVEIDVKLTKDKIPILFHDENLSLRLINQSYLIGNISNYTFEQLQNYVTLKNGEKIPTLQQALSTVLNNTVLEMVWLDIKSAGIIPLIKDLVKSYNDSAKILNRNLKILIGIPTDEVYKDYLNLSNQFDYPALCEISPEKAEYINAEAWAPRWSLGLQTEEVQRMHSKNIKVYTWTLDETSFIRKYIKDGDFDGILTNYPSVVAYEYYIK